VLHPNAPRQEVHAHMTSDSLWLKDWLQKRRMTHPHSRQKQTAVPLKVRFTFNLFCMESLKLHFLFSQCQLVTLPVFTLMSMVLLI
jgi:hypothetical protein